MRLPAQSLYRNSGESQLGFQARVSRLDSKQRRVSTYMRLVVARIRFVHTKIRRCHMCDCDRSYANCVPVSNERSSDTVISRLDATFHMITPRPDEI